MVEAGKVASLLALAGFAVLEEGGRHRIDGTRTYVEGGPDGVTFSGKDVEEALARMLLRGPSYVLEQGLELGESQADDMGAAEWALIGPFDSIAKTAADAWREPPRFFGRPAWERAMKNVHSIMRDVAEAARDAIPGGYGMGARHARDWIPSLERIARICARNVRDGASPDAASFQEIARVASNCAETIRSLRDSRDLTLDEIDAAAEMTAA